MIAIWAHSNESKVQELGCAALVKLARNSDANCVSIVAKYGLEVIASVMATHSNASKVQVEGCGALGNLACNDENCVSIAAKHGIEAIVSAMTAHGNVSKVQVNECLALFNLTSNQSVAVRIQLARGSVVLEQNPSNSDADTSLQRIKALMNLGKFCGCRLDNLVCELGDLICGQDR
jgi:hypothetical protein